MPIPKHKCTAYCEPDEEIHCLPNRWFPGKTVADFQFWISIFEIIRVREESDVRPDYYKAIGEQPGFWHKYEAGEPDGFVGYLVWMREKEK